MITTLLLSLALAAGEDGLWGNVGFGMYPANGEKVAPNGMVYEPMFRLVGDLSIGSSDSYWFVSSAYYTERPNPGVTTNKTQGDFDFTKRQYDFNIGYAWELAPAVETRFWLYSYSNINRGKELDKPYGFKDGFIGALRYYFDEPTSLQGHATAGYYFTKDLADTEGEPYSPGVFVDANGSYFLGYGIRGYAQAAIITKRPAAVHEIDTQVGLQYRFGERRKSQVFFYLENDFGTSGLPERRRILLEFRRDFLGS